MSVKIKVGAHIPRGLKEVKRFKKLRFGNLIEAHVPLSREEALAFAEYCRENEIYFVFYQFYKVGTFNLNAKFKVPDDLAHAHGFYTREEFEEIMKKGGPYFIGRVTLNEVGGSIYWPKYYVINRAEGEWDSLPPAKDMKEAKEKYLQRLREYIKEERKRGKSALCDMDASILFKYHREAGIDISHLEVMPAAPYLSFSAVRGASRAGKDKRFGAYIAMTAYGGKYLDSLWFKRWKLILYYSYLAGANFIYSEDGHYSMECITRTIGGNYEFDSPECEKFREILREMYEFAQLHPRPDNGPRVKLGVVFGNLDGYSGVWSKYVWGQFGEEWKHSPPEWGWDYVKNFYRKEDWFSSTLVGEVDFSGNPPYGQYDIVPIESSQENLNQYSCLIFLGWNTMTGEIYKKLVKYVKQGGHLIMAVPHLSTHLKRTEDLKLYNNGDFRDLFGVRVKGKGKVWEGGGIKYINHSTLPTYRFPYWGKRCDPKFVNGDIPLAEVELEGAKILAVTAGHFDPELEKETYPVLIENTLGKCEYYKEI